MKYDIKVLVFNICEDVYKKYFIKYSTYTMSMLSDSSIFD